MLRRDLLKFIAGLPFCGVLKNKESYAAYTIPNCNKIPEKAIVGIKYYIPTNRYRVLFSIDDNIVKKGDELFINNEGKMTKDTKFKQNGQHVRFFALDNKDESGNVLVSVINLTPIN